MGISDQFDISLDTLVKGEKRPKTKHYSLLEQLVANENTNDIEEAIKDGVDVQMWENWAIIHSSRMGYSDLIKLLIDNGADVNIIVRSENIEIPLIFDVIEKGNEELAKIILSSNLIILCSKSTKL